MSLRDVNALPNFNDGHLGPPTGELHAVLPINFHQFYTRVKGEISDETQSVRQSSVYRKL